MSQPCEPDSVKLISSLFSPRKELIEEVIGELSSIHGPVDCESPECFFDRTKYYEREMGWPLHRRFIAFEKLIPADRLAETKLETNKVEQRHLKNGRREINIDPGIISAERLILATGKNYIHRVYLSNGIYADLTLVFKRGTFSKLPWTYPDYADPKLVEFFNGVRTQYMEQLKEMRRLD